MFCFVLCLTAQNQDRELKEPSKSANRSDNQLLHQPHNHRTTNDLHIHISSFFIYICVHYIFMDSIQFSLSWTWIQGKDYFVKNDVLTLQMVLATRCIILIVLLCSLDRSMYYVYTNVFQQIFFRSFSHAFMHPNPSEKQ